MAKSICFFNNKGGVGKTTLICNVASYLSTVRRLRVLLVDADPQCNSTQLVFSESSLEEIYQPFKRAQAAKIKSNQNLPTLYDILLPVAKGEPKISPKINPILGSNNRFNLDVIPGHPRVALLEDQLSQAWVNFGAGYVAGAAITNWNKQLVILLDDRYDLILFDVGPSLGALNRSVLVGVDYFVTPMGCDIFSMAGVDNIAAWMTEWLRWYEKSLDACQSKWGGIEYDFIRQDVLNISRFIGYTVQQYITKTIHGERRATKAYEKILKKIPEAVKRELGSLVTPRHAGKNLHLGDVPNMFSLVPLAQNANTPISELTGSDGLVGTQYTQKENYVGFIAALSEQILINTKLG